MESKLIVSPSGISVAGTVWTKRLAVAFVILAAASSIVSGADVTVTDWLRVDPANGGMTLPTGGNGDTEKPERIRVGVLLDQLDDSAKVHNKDQLQPGTVAIAADSPKTPAPNFEIKGTFETNTPGKPLAFHETLTKNSANDVSLSMELKSSETLQQKAFCLNFLLNKRFQGRSVLFDGNAVKLPEALSNPCLFFTPEGKGVQSITIPATTRNIQIEGTDLSVLFCQYQDGSGAIWIYLAPPKSEVTEAKLAISIKNVPYAAEALDISHAANMAFRDGAADDKKGGWTDQGAENDLEGLPLGDQMFGNVSFHILDPAANQNRSCLAFANSARPYFLKSADIDAGGKHFSWLYLLHATAWSKASEGQACGTLTVNYQDGATQSIDVVGGKDVGDWWQPSGSPNAAVVWKGQNKSSEIGLYLSRFQVQDKPISKLTLATTGKAVWLVAGISGVADASIPQVPSTSDVGITFTTAADPDWRTFTFAKNTVKGSALDLSFMADAPAGKYGRVMIKDGKFVFQNRPDQPVRFFGASICYDMVTGLTKPQCETLADQLAAMGYNAVRLHHYDDSLIKAGATGIEFDPQRLDQMDYLISCLEQKGLYIVTDLYISRVHGFPAEFKELTEVKFAAAFSPEILANLEDFDRQFLTHVNPYTKLALKDDPALATLSLTNENALFTHYTLEKINGNAYLKDAFQKSLQAWCAAKKVTTPDDPAQDPQDLAEFLLDKQQEVYAKRSANLRAMGVQQPFTEMAHRSLFIQTIPRNGYDYVENHRYVDHPNFTGAAFQSSTINDDKSALQGIGDLLQCGAPRIFGKPFAVTEWNFCYPNSHRGESGAVMGAYGSLQDWDGLFRFDYATSPKETFGDIKMWAFDIVSDPIQALSEKMAAFLFLRQDVAAAKKRITFAVTPQVWQTPFAQAFFSSSRLQDAWFPPNFCELGTYCQIGSNLVTPDTTTLPVDAVVARETLPPLQKGLGIYSDQDGGLGDLVKAGIVPANAFAPDAHTFQSETGQVDLNAKELSFKVVTPKSECLIQKGAEQEGTSLGVKANTTFSTIFAGSLDGNPLASSKHVLVFHLTDLRNSGEKRTQKGGQLIIERGTGQYPLLLRKGSAQISLHTENKGLVPHVWALALTGEQLREVPVTGDDGSVTFTASTDEGDVAALAYEVTWEAAPALKP